MAQPVVGGIPRFVRDLVIDQVGRGYTIAVACPRESPLASWASFGGARHVAWQARRAPGPSVVREVRNLGSVVDEIRPDLVHLHSSKAGLVGRLCLRGRLPTIFQPHAWSFFAVRGAVHRAAVLWERAAARWTDLILCVSDDECRRGREAGIKANLKVVYNGVDLDLYSARDERARQQARASLNLDDGPLAVCVGRLSEQKGQDLLVAAWPQVRRSVPDARLVLIGDGPDRSRLQSAASEDVLLTGESDAVPTWLAASDVVVIPSRWEGLSLVMLEAMATGRSVVSTDVPGAREALHHIEGAVVPIESPGSLARAVVLRLVDAEQAASEGRQNRKTAVARYDARRQRDALAEIYAHVVEARS